MSVLNRTSSRITQPRSQGASQAMLLGTGLTPSDLDKPQVGIASMWYEGNTCNMHLDRLAAKVREGVAAAGMVGMRFNTIGVSDGISMGTEGMSYSLPSRDVIADSIETVMQAQWYDALVAIPGCDKNMPGCLIAMGRLNRPALMVYGGTIKPGHLADGSTLDIVSAFQCYGEYVAGRIDDARRADIVRHACPGAGACGGMYTANTMATAIEALGMALPDSASIPAEHPDKEQECLRAGATVEEFWDMTPAETVHFLMAALWREERARERILTLAWAMAALSRARRIPTLHRWIRPHRKPVTSGKEVEKRRAEHAEIVNRMSNHG